jgi:glycine betaine/proline transport system substrate-binding protein
VAGNEQLKQSFLARIGTIVASLVLVLSACSNSTEEVPQNPGDGIHIDMARADWSTGYFQAAVVEALLGELGYEVSDPSLAEMAPSEFFPMLAAGDTDFWVNTWIPSHTLFLSESMISGGTVADGVSLTGSVVTGGAFQGFVVDVATAEANGIKYLDDIAEDPGLAALFDVDGDGAADLTGCNEGWGCNLLIEELIETNGWQNTITQVVGDFDTLWAAEVDGYTNGVPVLSYIWAPSAFVAQLVPGEDVLWLSVRGDQGDSAEIALPPSQCPAQPCKLGLPLNEILAAGNVDFFDANPAVEFLLSVVGIPLTDIAVQNLKMLLGEDSEADIRGHAEQWIADNRTVVDSWLDAARSTADG